MDIPLLIISTLSTLSIVLTPWLILDRMRLKDGLKWAEENLRWQTEFKERFRDLLNDCVDANTRLREENRRLKNELDKYRNAYRAVKNI